jgi:aminoglycoside phosphotransferase (APT) family kinase protein
MGDFWPGNIMVSLNKKGDLERLHILDWELTKAGLPGIEIGQFCAEIHMLRRFNGEVCQDTATLVLEHFLKAYARLAGDGEQARRAFVHMGVHMSVLGARVEWGEKEVTRQVVLEGLRKIVDGYPYQVVNFSRLAQE